MVIQDAILCIYKCFGASHHILVIFNVGALLSLSSRVDLSGFGLCMVVCKVERKYLGLLGRCADMVWYFKHIFSISNYFEEYVLGQSFIFHTLHIIKLTLLMYFIWVDDIYRKISVGGRDILEDEMWSVWAKW